MPGTTIEISFIGPQFSKTVSQAHVDHVILWVFLCEDPEVLDEAMGPLLANVYHGESRSLISELQSRLPHEEPILKNDNAAAWMKIEEDTRRVSIESKIESFSRHKDARGAFQALMSNHAGEVKHRSTSKKRCYVLQNIICDGRCHPLENHVSNHRKDHNCMMKWSAYMQFSVPRPE